MKRFSEFIVEARTSQAAQKAHKLGLVGDGHGYWVDKQKKRVARTLKGQLQFFDGDRKSTRLNSSHIPLSRMPSSA